MKCQYARWRCLLAVVCVCASRECKQSTWVRVLNRLNWNEVKLKLFLFCSMRKLNAFLFLSLLFFQLSEIVNSVSPQGQLPLGIALMGRSTNIAQTLVQTGKADLNAYNAEVRKSSQLFVGKTSSFLNIWLIFAGLYFTHWCRPTWWWIFCTISTRSWLWCEFNIETDQWYSIACCLHLRGRLNGRRLIQRYDSSWKSAAHEIGWRQFAE